MDAYDTDHAAAGTDSATPTTAAPNTNSPGQPGDCHVSLAKLGLNFDHFRQIFERHTHGADPLASRLDMIKNVIAQPHGTLVERRREQLLGERLAFRVQSLFYCAFTQLGDLFQIP